MTIIEAITGLDAHKRNAYSQEDKVKWLSRLDSMAKRLVIDTHEGGEETVFDGYGDDTDLHTVLLIPAPFDEVYLRWMEAQIDYANGEYDRYNNAIEMFNTAWEAYRNDYNRNHMPLGTKFKFF